MDSNYEYYVLAYVMFGLLFIMFFSTIVYYKCSRLSEHNYRPMYVV